MDPGGVEFPHPLQNDRLSLQGLLRGYPVAAGTLPFTSVTGTGCVDHVLSDARLIFPDTFFDSRPDCFYVPRYAENYLHVVMASVVLRCDEASRGYFVVYMSRGSVALDLELRYKFSFTLSLYLFVLIFSSAHASGSSKVTRDALYASDRSLWNRLELKPGEAWVFVPNCHLFVLCVAGDSIRKFRSSFLQWFLVICIFSV